MNIERMRTAVAFWASVPSTQWNLNLYYFSPNKCGCALGLLATNNVAGFFMDGQLPALTENTLLTPFEAGTKGFDLPPGAATSLFGRVAGKYSLDEPNQQPTHKQIFFSRLDEFLAEQGIPLSAIYGPDQREQNDPLDDPEKMLEHPQVSEDECA